MWKIEPFFDDTAMPQDTRLLWVQVFDYELYTKKFMYTVFIRFFADFALIFTELGEFNTDFNPILPTYGFYDTHFFHKSKIQQPKDFEWQILLDWTKKEWCIKSIANI